ncbi:MAG: DUF1989 domain-containing protein [Rhodobacteraceae bacterium]|nr:DUF1989 domain-containing protein [Paracoccaceae bacterium]
MLRAVLILPDSVEPERRRYRGMTPPNRAKADVHCGEAMRLPVADGTVVSIANVDGCSSVWLTALSEDRRNFGLDALELPEGSSSRLDLTAFDSREMTELAASRGGQNAQAHAMRIFDEASGAGDVFVVRVARRAELFVIVPATAELLTLGGGGRVAVTARPRSRGNRDQNLPEPLGKVVDEWRVERCTAKAYELRKDQFVQIIDVEGQQCSDFMALRADALDAGVERHIDSTVSRTMTRSAYPMPGLFDKFFDQDMRPLLAVRRDTVGRHDTFALACTARGYEERGFPGHLNCSDNISAEFEPFGILPRKAWPAINFFFNSWIDCADNRLVSDEAWSRPGDHVAMQALTDLVCVTTACPDDVDPINGWNPTDIHVRIYEEDTRISRSVAWRAHPEDAARLTKRSAFHARTSRLTNSFHVARDVWMPAHFDATGAIEEYWACRTAATLQDMSSLRKFDIVGPDALELLQHCLTRDVSRLSRHRGLYALMCDDRGSVLDDGTLFRLEDTAFRWCCGSENSALHLREWAEQLGLNARILSIGDSMPNLALQGPRSRDILRAVAFIQPHCPALENLRWFGFTVARLKNRDGPMFMLSRTGFTGELGYEIFCGRRDACEIWDGIMEAGQGHGLVPMGGEALNLLRIEAGFMLAGAEFCPDSDALESGLGFVVDFRKPDFVGRRALARNASAPRRKLVGLRFGGNEAPVHGDCVFVGRERVGVVTSACSSPQLGHAIAMARVAVENAEKGSRLEVGKLDGHMKRLPAIIVDLPFMDPMREKVRA